MMLSIFLSVFFALPNATEAGFSDVARSSVTYEAIKYLQDTDILRGDPSGTFRPKDSINRAEFTAVVMRSLRSADVETECTTLPKFTDVLQSSWYYQDVCEAFNAELINGYSDGSFKPEKTISLAEAAKIVAISYDLDPNEVRQSTPWYKAGLQYLSEYSALPTFLPKQDQPITREQMAEILYRMELEVDKPSLDISDFDLELEEDTLEYSDYDAEYCDELLSYEEEWTEEDESDWYENCEYEIEEDDDHDSDYEDEDFTMTENECLEDELYDEIEQMCYIDIDCETDEECEALIAEYESAFEDILEDEQQGYEELDYDSDSVAEIASYSVQQSSILQKERGNVNVEPWQKDEENHREIWNFYANLIPAELRTHVTEFIVTTDGKDGELAAVAANDSLQHWTLYVDIADAYSDNGNTIEEKSFAYSLIHEQMHLLSLQESEFSTTNSPCATYEVEEGCLRSDALLHRFYTAFWRQHKNMLNASNSEDLLYAYYDEHPEEFVSDYAATNPTEDIAETFAEFVLRNRPSGKSIAEQKILFFYKEPELVALRSVLRNRLKSVVVE